MQVRAHQEPSSVTASSKVIPYGDLRAHCGSCGVRELCLPLGLAPDGLRQLERVAGAPHRVKKRSALFRPGDPFAALYAIRLGTFKTLVLAEDGREQITGYHISGDIIGLDGLGEAVHGCEAVALEDSEVCELRYDALDRLARDVPELRHNLYRLLSRSVCRGQGMMFMLGSMRAEERLATFLLDLANRYHSRGYSSSEFVLRMTREETASYLGLKLETVSRLFSRLQGEGMIQVQGRAVKLLDPLALKRLGGHAG
jgi:CRP/FNR family transcriptional regulator, anaerobic regulatory protein